MANTKIFGSRYSWLLLLVILVVVNFLASIFHSRIDLTKEKRYTLTKATNGLLNQLDDDLQIDVFLKGDFPSGFRKLANSTQEFLSLLKDRNSSRIHYNFISPQDELPDIPGVKYQDTLQRMGVSPINLTVQVKEGQEQKYVFPVALITYKGRTNLINLYSGGSRFISQVEINNAEALLEYQFLKNIDELVHPEKPVVGYAIGNGEPAGPESYDLRQTISQRYQFYSFNLATQKFIPDQFNVLIVVKPSMKFTDDELLKIDQFMMRGGNVMFFVDRLYAEMDSLMIKPQVVAYDRGLDLTEFLFHYGVRINTDLIMDLQCDFLPFIVGGTPDNPQKEYLPWNYFPVFQSADNHIINKSIGLVAGRFVNSIDTVGARTVKKTILLSSSSNSRVISTPALISLNENRRTPEDEKFKSTDIPAAVLLEGKFISAFKNNVSRSIRDSLVAAGIPFRDSSAGSPKLIVAGDGDLVMNSMDKTGRPMPMGFNPNTYQEYLDGTESGRYFIPFANSSFLMNCLEYFTNKPGIAEAGNKEIVLRLLDSKKVREQKSTWQLINIALPVILVILFGFIYQALRKRKYAR